MEPTVFKANDETDAFLIEVRVTGSSKKMIIQDRDEGLLNKNNNLISLLKRRIGQKSGINISLKGIGLSFIDEKPQELLFLTIQDINLSFF